MVNGKPPRALADTGTIEGTLLSNHFVTRHNTFYKLTKNAGDLKMSVKVSRSTIHDSLTENVDIGKMKGRDVEMIIPPVSDYPILLSMSDLKRMGVVIYL